MENTKGTFTKILSPSEITPSSLPSMSKDKLDLSNQFDHESNNNNKKDDSMNLQKRREPRKRILWKRRNALPTSLQQHRAEK
jgi:hypothetical protein